MKSVLGSAVTVLACLGTASTAFAQTRPGIDTQTWRPSTDPNASLVNEPAITPGAGVLTLGAYGQYNFHSVSLRSPGSGDTRLRPISDQLMLTPIANIGVGDRLAFGASLPIVVFQDGTRPIPPSLSDSQSIPHSTIGDLAFNGKFNLIKNDQGGFGLSALGVFALPTGNRESLMSEVAPTVSGRVLAEYTLLVASVEASLGYKFRTEPKTWPTEEAGGVRFGSELPWTFAIVMRPGVLGIDPKNRQRLEVGVHGWVPVQPVGPFGIGGQRGASALSPMQLALSDRIEIGHYRDTFLTLGGELGLTEAVGVPVFRAVAAIGWTPRTHDSDDDGVKDDLDGCPDIPEDIDGFEDADGCPDIDNDQDGIIDREDACRDVKGDPSPDPKLNGCPGVAKPPEPPPVPVEPPKPVEPPPPVDPDKDGDTFLNEEDKCPDQAEVFNGVDDTDGCPDEGGTPLVAIDDKNKLKLTSPLKLGGTKELPEVDAASLTTLRAIAQQLNAHKDWTLIVGTKPAPAETQLDALAKSFAIVKALSDFTHRDGAAETVGWDAVKDQPGAASGIAFRILAPQAAPTAAAPPAAPKPAPAPLPAAETTAPKPASAPITPAPAPAGPTVPSPPPPNAPPPPPAKP